MPCILSTMNEVTNQNLKTKCSQNIDNRKIEEGEPNKDMCAWRGMMQVFSKINRVQNTFSQKRYDVTFPLNYKTVQNGEMQQYEQRATLSKD